jgi:hypothetical protein
MYLEKDSVQPGANDWELFEVFSQMNFTGTKFKAIT